ncbi:MAG: site-specific integrase [Gemmatimonadaceae bacterium]|nr:site-specific integrase [Gemmatimonadaceae bacterium]
MPKLSRVKLTKRTVDATKAPATGETFVWDSEVRGFGLRVYPSGRRLFVFQYVMRATGKSRRVVLGGYPAITADQARELAQRAAAQVAEGKDPKGDDTEGLQRRTMGEVFPNYLSERRGKIATRTYAEYERTWEKALAATFGDQRLATLDEATVVRWHAARIGTPIAANRAVDLLSSFLTWSERRGYRAKHTNPCEGVERFDEVKKGRSLSVEEYQRLGAAFDAAASVGIRPAARLRKASTKDATKNRRPKNADEPRPQNPVILAALRFLTLSGWREQEALTLRWDAVDLERGVAVLADTKSGRSERPLGTPALDVLRSQPRVAGNPFVFVGERDGQHIAEVKYTWASIKEAAKLDDAAPFRLHDLRHSFTTVARDEMGLGDHVIARLVGHTLSGMTSRYGEVRDATVRNAANSIATTIAQYLCGAEAKVLPFQPRQATS